VADSNNNRIQKFIVSNIQEPDFVVSHININPVSPTAENTFTAQVTVKNRGIGAGNGGRLIVWPHKPKIQIRIMEIKMYQKDY